MRKKIKKALKKSKVEGEPLEELLRARALGDSTSGPPVTIVEFFTSPTTTIDASS